jgi:hypothetical protein
MDADDLYGLPLEQFVPERNALARALRANDRREEAVDVLGLRKPSVAAWAVNQLVRTQRRALSDLFKAGDSLREAQADVLAGRGDGQGLRAAAGRERAAVDELVSAARSVLTSMGNQPGTAIIDRVADTLHAAALDDDARRIVGEGRLERELRRVGLGDHEGGSTSPLKRAGRKRTAEERAAAQRAELARAAARKAARAAESEARRLAERARRALHVAEERRERAAQALRTADRALETARAEADDAADAHRRAREELDSS